MDIETLNAYVDTLITVAPGRADDPGELYSGGEEKVWCESQSKALELFAMEFATFVRNHPGQMLWGKRPHLLDQKVFTKTPTNFMKELKLYCACASFEIIVAGDNGAVEIETPEPDNGSLECRHCGERFSRAAARRTHETQYCKKKAVA